VSKNFLPGILHKKNKFGFMQQRYHTDFFTSHGGTVITHDRQAELSRALLLVGAYNTRNNRRKLVVAIRRAS
jgi:hypothetical protein